MTKHHFSFKDVFCFGWDKTRQHAWFLFLTFIIAGVLVSAIRGTHMLAMAVGILMILSIASISLTISRNHSFTFYDLFTPLLSPRRVLTFAVLLGIVLIPALITGWAWALFVAGALTKNISMASFGLILGLITTIPALFVLVRMKFFPFVFLDNEHMRVQDILRTSYQLTHNHFWIIFTFLLMAAVLNTLGVITCVGLLITIPTTLFANAYIYNKLKDHTI